MADGRNDYKSKFFSITKMKFTDWIEQSVGLWCYGGARNSLAFGQFFVMNSTWNMIRQSYPKAVVLYFGQIGNSGPGMVVLHGLFCSGKNWRSFARTFEKNFQVCTVDARNHSGRLLRLQCVISKWRKMLFPFWTTMDCKESFSCVIVWGVKLQCSLQCSYRKGSRLWLWLILRLFNINIAKRFLN